MPATGANARAVAEYVIGTLLVLLRGAYGASAAVADGSGRAPRCPTDWRRMAARWAWWAGGIGRLVATLARGLGMRVVGHDAALPAGHPAWGECGVESCSLDALLERADAVSLHLPLTPDTRLFDAARISRMRAGAVLIIRAAASSTSPPWPRPCAPAAARRWTCSRPSRPPAARWPACWPTSGRAG